MRGQHHLLCHNVAKNLVPLQAGPRQDVKTAVTFLTIWAKEPDVNDYKKFQRSMQYLCGTVVMPITLEAENAHTVKWCVSVSFAVHSDMKSQAGGMIYL
jgi:hypothetical protein